MTANDIAITSAFIVALLLGIFLGRLSLLVKTWRLKKENQTMQNLLYKLASLENLNSQMFCKIFQEFARKDEQARPDLRIRK